MAEKWVQKADISKGGLHRSLHVPEGEKIPAAKVEAATHSDNPKIRRQANLAQTFAHIRPHGSSEAKVAHHPHGRDCAHGCE